MLHGPYGEDGTIQGLLELANVPYVGAGVLASAVGMDKAIMKLVFSARGLPVCPYRVVLRHEWTRDASAVAAGLDRALGFPMFVKPANLGSSVGISKAKDRGGARRGDGSRRQLRSQDRRRGGGARTRARSSAPCSATTSPSASVPGEIVPSREFYDYEAKYLDDGSKIVIPADAADGDAGRGPAAGGRGVPRDRRRRHGPRRLPAGRATPAAIYVNEVNTIPGFTTISMYSKLWAAQRRRVSGRCSIASSRSRSSGTRRSSSCAPASHDPQPRRAWCWPPGHRRCVATVAAGERPDARSGVRAAVGPRPRRPPPTPDRPALVRGEEALARAYDLILDARFDQVDAELQRACGPAPPEACDVLAATALWWRILLDPDNRSLDDEFSTAVDRGDPHDRGLDRARARRCGGVVLPRRRVRARGCSGGCCARSGSRPRATASGSRRRSSAPSSSTPGLEDAYFGIGLYKYYADVAPAAAKVLRFLLLLPGGDKQEGLAQMLRARNGGRLLQGEADYQLHLIYFWYERQPARALELLRGLQKRYPGNPLFPAQIAEIQDTYLHDVTASLDCVAGAAGRARASSASTCRRSPKRRRGSAPRGSSRRCTQTDRALELLAGLVVAARRDGAVLGAVARAHLRDSARRTIASARARRRWRRIRVPLAAAPADDPYEVRDRAAELMRRAPNARTAEAYRLSLEGWRQLEDERRRRGRARRWRNRSRSNVEDPVAHYRFGRVLEARRDDPGALAHFEIAIRNARSCPAPILAMAYLEAARLHERAGRRADAIDDLSRPSTTLFGAAEETRNAATRALARLTQALIDRARHRCSRRVALQSISSRADTSWCAHF